MIPFAIEPIIPALCVRFSSEKLFSPIANPYTDRSIAQRLIPPTIYPYCPCNVGDFAGAPGFVEDLPHGDAEQDDDADVAHRVPEALAGRLDDGHRVKAGAYLYRNMDHAGFR